jgi:hypothetical protein
MITLTHAFTALVEEYGDRIALQGDTGALTLDGWPAGNLLEHAADAPDGLQVAMLVDLYASEHERLGCRCGGAMREQCSCPTDPLGGRGGSGPVALA